jgi:hypothetical protein
MLNKYAIEKTFTIDGDSNIYKGLLPIYNPFWNGWANAIFSVEERNKFIKSLVSELEKRPKSYKWIEDEQKFIDSIIATEPIDKGFFRGLYTFDGLCWYFAKGDSLTKKEIAIIEKARKEKK